jgi:hypothetical protein
MPGSYLSNCAIGDQAEHSRCDYRGLRLVGLLFSERRQDLQEIRGSGGKGSEVRPPVP